MTEQHPPADPHVQSTTDTLQALDASLCELAESGAQHLDPARWHLLTVLIQRARQQPEATAGTVITAATTTLQHFDNAFRRAQSSANDTLARIENHFPEHLTTARQLLATGDFKQLKRLAHTLQRNAQQQSLQQLNRQLEQPTGAVDSETDSVSFNTNLQQQDSAMVPSTVFRSGSTAEQANGGSATGLYPLKAALWSQRNRHRYRADHLIQQINADCPANSGPLHPQRLIANSLASIGNISPHYLNRVLAQWQTLLMLEQSNADNAQQNVQQ